MLRGLTVTNGVILLTFAVIDDTTKEIVYRDYVDISVAVATPKVGQILCSSVVPAGRCTQVGNGFCLSGSGGSCNPKCGRDEFC